MTKIQVDLPAKGPLLTASDYTIKESHIPSSTCLIGGNQEFARIGSDGIMRFTVAANDENAARFVECIELYIGRRLAGVSVSESAAEATGSKGG